LAYAALKRRKRFGVTRRQLYQTLYNVINGGSAVTPEMAARFEKAGGGRRLA
jgi:hypothetical protein